MPAPLMSPQEEETLALAAVQRLGEASAHEVARELGVEVIRHTLGRLVDRGRLVKRLERSSVPGADCWVYRVRDWRPRPADLALDRAAPDKAGA